MATGQRVTFLVCTGALLLAAAGLLNGRRATTHWDAGEELARRYPRVAFLSGVLDMKIPRMEAEMARVLYTAEATVTGGRARGHGRTNDGALDVQLRSPKEMGGEGGRHEP